MSEVKISDLMLERYKIGDLDAENRKNVDEALSVDENLRKRLESLDESDRDLHQRYPFESLKLDVGNSRNRQRGGVQVRRFAGKQAGKSRQRFAGIAVVFMAAVLLPVLYFARNVPGAEAPTDRAKGAVRTSCELSLFLEDNREFPLDDKVSLGSGDIVQLAYAVPSGAEHHGVIFSIDGRSEVTLHYPYRKDQSSLLVSGRRTLLDEAYALDDAPLYEVFVMVTSYTPLDVGEILSEAGKIAKTKDTSATNVSFVEIESRAAFSDSEIAVITVLKE